MKKIIGKIFLLFFLSVMVLFGFSYSGNVASDNNTIKAAGAIPYQFGGRVTYYQPACQSDPITGVCANCPMCTTPGLGVGNYVCNGYQEVQFAPVPGSMPPNFVCLPKGFVVKQSMPAVGGQIMGGGASNIVPWVVAASP